MEFSISLSDILTFIGGLLSGITLTIVSQKYIFNNSYRVQQNNNKANKIIGRDDNSVN